MKTMPTALRETRGALVILGVASPPGTGHQLGQGGLNKEGAGLAVLLGLGPPPPQRRPLPSHNNKTGIKHLPLVSHQAGILRSQCHVSLG